MNYKILIIRGAQAESEKIQTQLGTGFNWLSVPPDWQAIENALKQHPIKVAVIAGGKRDLVYDCIRYAEEAKPGVAVFVVSSTPWILTTLVRKFPKVNFINDQTLANEVSGFHGFEPLIPTLRQLAK